LNLGNRLVAFFDVLGFSKNIQEHSLDGIHKKLSTFIDEADKHVFSSNETKPDNSKSIRENFEVKIFAFDSIFLVSKPLDESHSASNFITATVHLMKVAGKHGFALRGAIDLDEVLYDKSRGIVLSKAQPSLVFLEKVQEWCGCCFTNKAFDHVFPELMSTNNTTVHTPIIKYEIPTKEGKQNALTGKVDYCLNWMVTMAPKELDNILEFLTGNKKIETKTIAIEYEP